LKAAKLINNLIYENFFFARFLSLVWVNTLFFVKTNFVTTFVSQNELKQQSNKMGIIEIKETAPDTWEAQYQGREGVYSIHAAIDRGAIVDFTCSCPSKTQRCKHLPIMREAIKKKKIGKWKWMWGKIKKALRIFVE
jgi:hypothetical protein